MWNSLFLYYCLLVIALFSIRTTVNLLLPNPVCIIKGGHMYNCKGVYMIEDGLLLPDIKLELVKEHVCRVGNEEHWSY